MIINILLACCTDTWAPPPVDQKFTQSHNYFFRNSRIHANFSGNSHKPEFLGNQEKFSERSWKYLKIGEKGKIHVFTHKYSLGIQALISSEIQKKSLYASSSPTMFSWKMKMACFSYFKMFSLKKQPCLHHASYFRCLFLSKKSFAL